MLITTRPVIFFSKERTLRTGTIDAERFHHIKVSLPRMNVFLLWTFDHVLENGPKGFISSLALSCSETRAFREPTETQDASIA